MQGNTIASRGSSDVAVGAVSASTGDIVWVADMGGTGMEYPWGFDIDPYGDLFMSGLTTSAEVTFGSQTLVNSQHADNGGGGSSQAYIIKLDTYTTVNPSCLTTCAGDTIEVQTGYCYIDAYCYADGTASSYDGQSCMYCDSSVSQTEWSGPLSDQCFIDDECYADGDMEPGESSSSYYGRRLAAVSQLAGDQPQRRLAESLCQQCMAAEDQTGWSVVMGYSFATGSCEAANDYDVPTGAAITPEFNLAMATSSQVGVAKQALAISLDSAKSVYQADFVGAVMETASPPPAAAAGVGCYLGGQCDCTTYASQAECEAAGHYYYPACMSYCRRRLGEAAEIERESALNASIVPVERRLSEAAETSLSALAQVTYPLCDYWTGFSTYFGSDTFVNDFIEGAFDGTGDFASANEAGRTEAVEKGMMDQLLVLSTLCAVRGQESVKANWDLAYAYFYGDAPTDSPYERANKRCANYGTCADDGTTALANFQILDALSEGQAAAEVGNVAAAVEAADKLMSWLLLVYCQASVRYAYKLDVAVESGTVIQGGDNQVEGWAFWRVIEPLVATADAEAAATVTEFYNPATPISGTDHYCPTLSLIMSIIPHLSNLPDEITVDDFGTLLEADGVDCSSSFTTEEITEAVEVVLKVEVASVEDVSQQELDDIREAFSEETGVDESKITVEVRSVSSSRRQLSEGGAVEIVVTIEVEDEDEAEQVNTAVSEALPDAEAATTFLEDEAGVTLTVVAEPTIEEQLVTVIIPASIPAPSPPAGDDDSKLSKGGLAGVVIGACVAIVLLLVVLYLCKKGSKGSSATTQRAEMQMDKSSINSELKREQV
jgi:hypothetical protein